MQWQCPWHCHQFVSQCWRQSRTDTPTRAWSQEHGSTAPQSRYPPEENKMVAFEVNYHGGEKGCVGKRNYTWTWVAERGNVKGVAIVENPKKEASCPLPQSKPHLPSDPPWDLHHSKRWDLRQREREREREIYFCLVNVVCVVICWSLVLFCLGLYCWWYHIAGRWKKKHAAPFSWTSLSHSLGLIVFFFFSINSQYEIFWCFRF